MLVYRTHRMNPTHARCYSVSLWLCPLYGCYNGIGKGGGQCRWCIVAKPTDEPQVCTRNLRSKLFRRRDGNDWVCFPLEDDGGRFNGLQMIEPIGWIRVALNQDCSRLARKSGKIVSARKIPGRACA